jgi:hypothetical protein
LHHLVRDVRRDDVSGRADGTRGGKRNESGTARDVEDTPARPQVRKREQHVLRRLQLRCPRGFVVVNGSIPTVTLNSALELRVHVT